MSARLALAELDAATSKNFSELLSDNSAWWRDFWAKGFIHLPQRRRLCGNSRTKLTIIFFTSWLRVRAVIFHRDRRPSLEHLRRHALLGFAVLVGQHQRLLQRPSCRLAGWILMDPMFSLYSGCIKPARWRQNSSGIARHLDSRNRFLNGPEPLPDDIAMELRELVLARKPWRNAPNISLVRRKQRCATTAGWNFQTDGKWDHGHLVVPDKGSGVLGIPPTFLPTRQGSAFCSGIATKYTMDTAWLRDRAYPMIKGAAEFYRNFPTS